MTHAKNIINPLVKPEIMTVLRSHLDLPDLARCLSVSKLWHATFLSLVWSTVSIKHRRVNPTVEGLSRHCHLIEDLTYEQGLWQQYESVVCSKLKFLRVNFTESTPIVIGQHNQLRCLVVIGALWSKGPDWRPADHLHNLSTLYLGRLRIDPTNIKGFWDMCTRLKVLSLDGVEMKEGPRKTMTFERLEVLSVWPRGRASIGRIPIFPPSYMAYIDWFTQCPNLISLAWDPSVFGNMVDALDRLATRLEGGACPKLRKMQLRKIKLESLQLNRLINAMRKVESLAGVGHGFNRLSMTALLPHFNNLKTLDIGESTTTSSLVPELLRSCPQLEELTLGDARSQDLLQCDYWAFTHSLKTLSVRVIFPENQDRDDHQQQLLERISELRNLEHLELLKVVGAPETAVLVLRLGKGLELLSTLTKLRALSVDNYHQRMTALDVEWMIKHWKYLSVVLGTLNPILNDELEGMLSAVGIYYNHDVHNTRSRYDLTF
ncbi:hypothetical protein B0O80DRAFT_472944 [Mortierella sp. GBAus27b]|nr:hypothetical protein B0O80DRAFT_472944 [Mortierella sp. GBAus27b]